MNYSDKEVLSTTIEVNNADDLLLKAILVMLCKFFYGCERTRVCHSIGIDETIEMIELMLKGSSADSL